MYLTEFDPPPCCDPPPRHIEYLCEFVQRGRSKDDRGGLERLGGGGGIDGGGIDGGGVDEGGRNGGDDRARTEEEGDLAHSGGGGIFAGGNEGGDGAEGGTG